jgi:hypothetical protein
LETPRNIEIVARNTLEIEEMLWKFLEILYIEMLWKFVAILYKL